MTEVSPLSMIPEYLQHQRRWTIFKKIWNEDRKKFDKFPCTPNGGKPYIGYPNIENQNDFANFTDIRKLCELDQSYCPAFYLLKKDRILFLDFDQPCKEPNFPSYTEESISGGYHVLGWYDGSLPIIPDTKECYQDRRWIVLTGKVIGEKRDINDITNTIIDRQGPAPANIKAPFKAPASIGEMRNTTLFKYACSMRERGSSKEAIEAALLAENKVRCKPPLEEKEVKTIAASAGKYEQGELPPTLAEVKPIKNSLLPEPKDTITPDEIEAKRAAYRKTVPDFPELPEGFFKDYMEFGKRMSYAVPEYHFGTILAVLSCAIGRKAVMISTSQRLYTNAYVMVIGQTTTSGKSTACNMGVDQFYTIIEQEGICEKLTKKNSPQSVIQRLHKIPNRLWHYDECAEFYADITNKWAAALESILCSVYDGSEVSYGLAAGKGKVDEFRAKDVFLSCLWNTTDGEIDRHANWNSFSNGFFPRFMWFWNFKLNIPRKNRAITEEDRKIKADIEYRIQKLRSVLHKIPGNDKIQFTPSEVIEDWKIQNDQNHLSQEHEVYRIATGRLMGQAYKIAMMFSLMDTRIQDEITKYDMIRFGEMIITIPDEYAKTALKIVDEYLRPRILYVAGLCESNKTKSGQDAIKKVLKKNDSVATKTKLLRNTHIRSKMMDELLSTMEEAGEVTIKMEQSTGTKPVMVVILNE